MDNPHLLYPNDVDNDSAHEDALWCNDMVVGMAYVPMQNWRDVYAPEEALARGTQFSDLDKPFFGEDIRK